MNDCPICGEQNSMEFRENETFSVSNKDIGKINVEDLSGYFCRFCSEGFYDIHSKNKIKLAISEAKTLSEKGSHWKQTWSIPESGSLNYPDALAKCPSGYRLPHRHELKRGKELFPNLFKNELYWTPYVIQEYNVSYSYDVNKDEMVKLNIFDLSFVAYIKQYDRLKRKDEILLRLYRNRHKRKIGAKQ